MLISLQLKSVTNSSSLILHSSLIGNAINWCVWLSAFNFSLSIKLFNGRLRVSPLSLSLYNNKRLFLATTLWDCSVSLAHSETIQLSLRNAPCIHFKNLLSNWISLSQLPYKYFKIKQWLLYGIDQPVLLYEQNIAHSQ